MESNHHSLRRLIYSQLGSPLAQPPRYLFLFSIYYYTVNRAGSQVFIQSFFVVEATGIEPATLSVQGIRSPRCATPPLLAVLLPNLLLPISHRSMKTYVVDFVHPIFLYQQ